MQFSTVLLTSALAALSTAAAVPSSLNARQVLTTRIWTGTDATGTLVNIEGPVDTYLVLGTNIDNLGQSAVAPLGWIVDIFQTAADGVCTGYMQTITGSGIRDLEPANVASCIRMRAPSTPCTDCIA